MPTVVRFQNGTAVLYPERLFAESGPVGRWSAGLSAELEMLGAAEAPVRTGTLAASVWSNHAREGSVSRVVSLGASAPHAPYVLGGTDRIYITGTGPAGAPRYIPVGKQSAYPPITRVYAAPRGKGYVEGQAQNDFLGRAVEAAAAHRPELSGFQVSQSGL